VVSDDRKAARGEPAVADRKRLRKGLLQSRFLVRRRTGLADMFAPK
jgi:hypothetical protein